MRPVKFLSPGGACVAAMTVMFGLAGPRPGQTPAQADSATPQAEAKAPQSFEVASIKPSAEDGRRVMFGISPGGRFNASGVSVKMLIQQAFDIRDFQITGGPGWLSSERYDIVAKAETSLTRENLKVMLQSLLAERFNFKFHRETRELPIYALVVGRSGPKLHKSETQTDLPEEGAAQKDPPPGGQGGSPLADVRAVRGPGGKGAMIRLGRGQLGAQMAGIKDLAMLLAQQIGRPGVDRTGLEGKYDFNLEWTPDESLRAAGPLGDGPPRDAAPVGDSSGPSIFTALQEQLGLKLESEKGPVEILVIDHIEKASAN